ncbi:hypothetical protein GCM10028821_14280 [Hymenobacter jeollabukensis]
MRLLRIIVVPPLVDELAHMGQRAKEIGVEQFAAKCPVGAFDIRIRRRLAEWNPVQSKTPLFTPFALFGANKFKAVVGAQLRGEAIALD